ncbi:MAG TPA: phage/plasmid primase, P4 family [Acidimicrobiales bacterium]|jgi:putative DNA primase/helicase|nr:phage/plasmid primase, P4 family [Acidimicrobiales bacterium]
MTERSMTERLGVAKDVIWLPYGDDGRKWAAARLHSSLVRRNEHGWYRCDATGGHVPVTDSELDQIRQSAPRAGDLPIWPPHEPLVDRRADLEIGVQPDRTRQLRTDAGNANRLVAAYGEDLHWVPQWGCWLTWDGRRWQRDQKGRVVELAKTVAQALWDEALTETDDTERKAAVKWALQSEGAQRIEAMIKLARTTSAVPVEPHELDADPWRLNVTNGTLDLRTGELRPHDRRNLMTKLAGVHFDPDAKAPTFWRFLERVQPDPLIRDYLQAAVGYSLTGATSEQALFMLWGAGQNGKTTFLEVMLTMLGDYATNAEADLLMVRGDTHPTGIADLAGARFVVSTEVQDGRRLDEAGVKRLTGSDTVTARHLYRDFFSFTPTHKLWVGANHRPVIRGTDWAIWRRLKLVPFTVTITDGEKDQRLPEKLRAELPGILAWAVVGCSRWRRHGLQEPDVILAATADYRADQDSVAAFITENCIVDAEVWVFAGQLYSRYQAWAKETGEHVLSQKRLGAILTDKGYERYQSGKTRWRGIALSGPLDGGTMEPSEPVSGKSPYTRTRSDFSETPLNGSMVPPSEGTF